MTAPVYVLLALPDGQWVALSPEDLTLALTRAAELMPAMPRAADTPSAAEDLLTAEQMQLRTGVPATWYLQQARLNAIPYVKAGKYRRFNPRAVEKHLARGTDTRMTNPHAPRKPLKGNAP